MYMQGNWDVVWAVYEYLDRFVGGQERAKQKLAVLASLYRAKCQCLENNILSHSLPRLNTLIAGPTGTGKTLLISMLAEYLEIPWIRIDCASLAQVGWKGESIEEILHPWAQYKLDSTGFGIILLDEFDKLGNQEADTSGRVPALGTQYNLLDLLDGRYRPRDRYAARLNNCLILCAGSFAEVVSRIKFQSGNIGFLQDLTKKSVDWKETLIKGGICRELVSRLVDVIETQELTRDEIRGIINNTERNSLQLYKNLCISLDFVSKDIEDLVDKVYKSSSGLRELDTAVFNLIVQKLGGRR